MYHNDRRFTSSKDKKTFGNGLRMLHFWGLKNCVMESRTWHTQLQSVTKGKEVSNENLNHLHVSQLKIVGMKLSK